MTTPKRPHVSPSQIATWRKCNRKWAYSRIRPRSENRYAAFGERAHAQAEQWLLEGTPPTSNTAEGRCILAGLEHLPLPKTAQVEVPFRFTASPDDAFDFLGRIDFLYGYDPGKSIVVGDHKTTGDLGYAMNEAELLADPQRVIYSYWAATEFNVEFVAAQWVYYRRQPPASHPVVVIEHRDQIADRFVEIHAEATAIVASIGREPRELPRNLEHCSAYGGCPYRAECLVDVSPTDRFAAQLKGK